MIEKYRLPDGTFTADVNEFVTEWDRIKKPFENLGFKVVAYDPGIVLCDVETGKSFELPVYAAKRLIEAMNRRVYVVLSNDRGMGVFVHDIYDNLEAACACERAVPNVYLEDEEGRVVKHEYKES